MSCIQTGTAASSYSLVLVVCSSAAYLGSVLFPLAANHRVSFITLFDGRHTLPVEQPSNCMLRASRLS